MIYLIIRKIPSWILRSQMLRKNLDEKTWKKCFRKCLFNYMGMIASKALIDARCDDFGKTGIYSPAEAVKMEFE